MSAIFDARKIPTSDRMAYWLDTVCSQILPVQIDPRHDSSPLAAMSCFQIGDMAIRTVVGGDHVYRRSEAEVRLGDPGTLQVGFPVGGSSILVQDGREAVLSAGDMVLYDSSRPFSLVMEKRFHWQVFLFPKSVLRRPDHELQEITAIRMRGDSGIAGVTQRFLRGIASDGARFEADPEAHALGQHSADLIGTVIHSVFGHEWEIRDASAVLRESVSDYIRANHSDHSLSPAVIASAQRVSLRRLHTSFEGTERTVMEDLRSVRLEQIRLDLGAPGLRYRTIGEISAAHGMPSLTSFSRAFRAVYGLTPSEYRATVLV